MSKMHKKYANWRTIELTQIYVRIILRILDREPYQFP